MRVLVVNDDAVTCEILAEDLRQFGSTSRPPPTGAKRSNWCAPGNST